MTYPSSFPVTRSQVKDPRYGPTEGKRLDRRANEDTTQIPPPHTRRQSPNSTPAPRPAVSVSHIPQQSPTVPRESLQQPQPHTEVVPQAEPQSTRPQKATDAPGAWPPPVQETTAPLLTTTQYTSHPENTEDTSESCARKTAPGNKTTTPGVLGQDDDMQDLPKPPAKMPGGYFTLMVQDE